MPIILAIIAAITLIQTQPDAPEPNLLDQLKTSDTVTITGEPMHIKPLGWGGAEHQEFIRYDPNQQHFKQ